MDFCDTDFATFTFYKKTSSVSDVDYPRSPSCLVIMEMLVAFLHEIKTIIITQKAEIL